MCHPQVLVVLVVLAGPSLAKLRKSSSKFSLSFTNSLFSTEPGKAEEFSAGSHDFSHFPFNPFTQFPELLFTTTAPLLATSWTHTPTTTLKTIPTTTHKTTSTTTKTSTPTTTPTRTPTSTPSPTRSTTPYPTSHQIPTVPVPEAKHRPIQNPALHRRRERRPYARELHKRQPIKTTTTTKQTLTSWLLKSTTTEKYTTTDGSTTATRTTFPTHGSSRSTNPYPRTTTLKLDQNADRTVIKYPRPTTFNPGESNPKTTTSSPETSRAVIHYPRTTTFQPEASRAVFTNPRPTTSSPEASRAIISYPRTTTSSPEASRAVLQYPRTTTIKGIPSSRATINTPGLVEEIPRSGGSSFKVSRREEVDDEGTVHGSYSYQAPNGWYLHSCSAASLKLMPELKGEQGSKSILDPCLYWENTSHF